MLLFILRIYSEGSRKKKCPQQFNRFPLIRVKGICKNEVNFKSVKASTSAEVNKEIIAFVSNLEGRNLQRDRYQARSFSLFFFVSFVSRNSI